MRGISLLPLLFFTAAVHAKVPRVSHPQSKYATKHQSLRTATTLLANTDLADDAEDDGYTGTGWETDAPSVKAEKENVWRVLSNDEAADVIQFIHDSEALNVTSVEDAGRCVNERLTPMNLC